MLSPTFIKLAKLYISHHLPDYLELFHPSIDASIDWTQSYESLDIEGIQYQAHLGQLFNLAFKHPFNQGIFIYWDLNSQCDKELIETIACFLIKLYTQHNLTPKCCLLLNADLEEQDSLLKLTQTLNKEFNLVIDCAFIKVFNKASPINTCTPLLGILHQKLNSHLDIASINRLGKLLSVLPLSFSDIKLLNKLMD